MSDFPSLHVEDLREVRTLKVCEQCENYFGRKADERHCQRCLTLHPWLDKPKKTRSLDEYWAESMGKMQ